MAVFGENGRSVWSAPPDSMKTRPAILGVNRYLHVGTTNPGLLGFKLLWIFTRILQGLVAQSESRFARFRSQIRKPQVLLANKTRSICFVALNLKVALTFGANDTLRTSSPSQPP